MEQLEQQAERLSYEINEALEKQAKLLRVCAKDPLRSLSEKVEILALIKEIEAALRDSRLRLVRLPQSCYARVQQTTN